MAGGRKSAESNGKAKPAYRDFAAALKAAIDTGRLANGEPSTAERLAAKLQLSARTIRNWWNAETLPSRDDLDGVLTHLRDSAGQPPKHLEALWQTAGAVPPAEPPEDRATLRGPARPVFGRRDEIDQLVTALTGTAPARLLVLGGGGIGKTTVTRAAATAPPVVQRYGVRGWFVELETVTDVSALQSAIARAIGVDSVARLEAILQRLAQAPGLLVLDNLETPWDGGDRPSVTALLQQVATVREVALLGSMRAGAAPRTLPWTPCKLGPLSFDAARELFRGIAPEVAAEDPILADFLRELGGLPLAIELVAHRAAHFGPDLREPWRRWQALGAALAQDPDEPEGRLTSLPRSLEFSLASPRLKQQGRRLFALLGQLPAGLCQQDRAALLGMEEIEATDQLLGLGLAHMAAGRLDLLPPIRSLAHRHHPPEGQDATSWVRHFLAETARFDLPILSSRGAEAVARLAPEHANIAAAMKTASEGPEHQAATAAVWSFTLLCRFTGRSGDALRDLASRRAAIGERHGEANCIKSLADIALDRSDHDAARNGYNAALPIYQQIGDRIGEANCIKSLADIALRLSDHDAARNGYNAALPIYQQIGSRLGEANCIQSLADIALRLSDHDAARNGYNAALPIYQQIGDRHGEANCIQSLADIALRLSDHDAALNGYNAVLSIYQHIGDRLGEANCIKSLADIALRCSDHDAARNGYNAALSIYQQIGDHLGQAICRARIGELSCETGDPVSGLPQITQAIAMFEQIGSTGNAAIARAVLKRLGG